MQFRKFKLQLSLNLLLARDEAAQLLGVVLARRSGTLDLRW